MMIFVKIATACLSAYVVFALAAIIFQRHLLYFPDNDIPDVASSLAPEMQVITINSEDGLLLNAWHHSAENGKPTVLYFHGNGGHIGYRDARLRVFIDQGYGVLIFDYRGYGGNTGKPTKTGLLLDAKAAVHYLTHHLNIPLENIVFYGESLGTGIAVETATKSIPHAIILEAPYTKVSEVALSHYWFFPFIPYVLKDDFNAIDHIDDLHVPLLILHGENDWVIPIRFGRRLFETANEPKTLWVSNDAGHDNLQAFGAMQEVLRFIDALNANAAH